MMLTIIISDDEAELVRRAHAAREAKLASDCDESYDLANAVYRSAIDVGLAPLLGRMDAAIQSHQPHMRDDRPLEPLE